MAQDPASTNLRKPLIGPDDKVVSDHRSGLFCPFNAGKTTITVKAGGLAYSTEVTVQAGSVQRPCGTRPLDPSRFKPAAAAPAAAAPPAPAPAPAPAPGADRAAAGAGRAAAEPREAQAAPDARRRRPSRPSRRRRSTSRSRRRASPRAASTPATPPPPAGAFARPIPPGGAVIRVFEEKREEEAAPESSSAAVAYRYEEHAPTSVYLYGVVVLAAFAGATLRLGLRRRERGVAAAAVHIPARDPYRPRSRRP